MDLTQQEVQAARGLLRRLDRQFKGWNYIRWVGLASSLAFLAAGMQNLSKVHGPCYVSQLSTATKPATRPVTQADLDMVRTDNAIDLSMSEIRVFVWTSSLITVLVAAAGIGFVLVNWRCESRDRLLAKLLRNYLEERQLLVAEGTKA